MKTLDEHLIPKELHGPSDLAEWITIHEKCQKGILRNDTSLICEKCLKKVSYKKTGNDEIAVLVFALFLAFILGLKMFSYASI